MHLVPRPFWENCKNQSKKGSRFWEFFPGNDYSRPEKSPHPGILAFLGGSEPKPWFGVPDATPKPWLGVPESPQNLDSGSTNRPKTLIGGRILRDLWTSVEIRWNLHNSLGILEICGNSGNPWNIWKFLKFLEFFTIFKCQTFLFRGVFPPDRN